MIKNSILLSKLLWQASFALILQNIKNISYQYLPLLQLELTSEDVWAAVLCELRLLLAVRFRRDGGVGGGCKIKKEGASC